MFFCKILFIFTSVIMFLKSNRSFKDIVCYTKEKELLNIKMTLILMIRIF